MILILHIYWIDCDWIKWRRKTKKVADTYCWPWYWWLSKGCPSSIAENKFVNEYNNKILNQMPEENVVIPCHDSDVSANIPAKECQNLINKLPDDYSKTGQLMKSLTLVVGVIVVMTVNVDVEDGLTNGASGVVKYIDYRMEGTNRPSVIWVLFDDPRIGRPAREKYRTLYNSSIHREWTPVFDVQRTFIINYKTYQRIQFLLTPASGITIYKAEGATVDEVVVDLSQDKKTRKISNIHYVALRRVKKLENIYFESEWSCYGFRRTSDYRDA